MTFGELDEVRTRIERMSMENVRLVMQRDALLRAAKAALDAWPPENGAAVWTLLRDAVAACERTP